VRIEDVDQTRCQPDAERQILGALTAFGMRWDRPPARQSERADRYRAALDRLAATGQAYRCGCSRRLIAAMARVGSEGPIYPGTCRNHPPPAGQTAAWRVKVDDAPITFRDRIVGEVQQRLATEIGDFVVRRVDGFAAYQLAVVVDDHAQGITDVVRGADLLWSTPRQIWLQRLLGYATPRYAHIPLVYGENGHKLSKRDAAHPMDAADPLPGLLAAWRHLGQTPPAMPVGSSDAFWDWAIPRWDSARIPHDRNIRHERPDSV
jgi:glutamyl-Q tRNA(Asp) synthetase